MNLKTKLAASLLLAASASMAQASTYSVTGDFLETMTNGVDTVFKGTFDWDGTTISNFTGTMNESMRGVWTAAPGHTYSNYGAFTALGAKTDMWPTKNTYQGQVNHLAANGLWMLNLNQNLIQSDTGSVHTATIFKENTSNVYKGGGYVGDPATNNFEKWGLNAGETVNENAFFTLAFTHDAAGNITSLGLQTVAANPDLVNQMIYGDCSVGSLMGQAKGCMAGEPTGSSLMAATAGSLEITQVAAVPVPGAVWLFGSALMGLLGVNRRKSVLSA